MTSTNTNESPLPPTDSEETKQQIPKKKTKPPLPPLPASLVTSICIVQAALNVVLGRHDSSSENDEPMTIMRTYLKDAPALTAKFVLRIPADALEIERNNDVTKCIGNELLRHHGAADLLRDALTEFIKELIAKNINIFVFESDDAAAAAAAGSSNDDASHTAAPNANANQPQQQLHQVYLSDFNFVTTLAGHPTKSTQTGVVDVQITECQLRVAKKSASRNASKAASKKLQDYELAVKIHVIQSSSHDGNDEEATTSDATSANAPLFAVPNEWLAPCISQSEIENSAARSNDTVKVAASNVLREQLLALQQDEERAAAESTASNAVAAITLEDKEPLSAAATISSEPSQADDDKQQLADDDTMVVNIETVSGKIDYTRLVENFGSSLLTPDLLQRLGKMSKLPLHRFLRRNIFFSHRDLDLLLNVLEQHADAATVGTTSPSSAAPPPFYLYTGRGPSSESMHMGHLIPFLFTKWLQDAFGVPLVVQMTDDEKFLFKGTYSHEEGDNLDNFRRLTMENAKDIIACGFDRSKTFLFSDLDYVGTMYPNIVRIWKAATTNTVNSMFGFDGSSNVGKLAFPAIQAAPAFASSFPIVLGGGGGNSEQQQATQTAASGNTDNMVCLIPCAIDQDPYFRLTRDVAHKLVAPPAVRKARRQPPHPLGGKPALIHSKFFPPLQGASGKMSSSDTNSAIFLTDSPDEISRKIKQHAFSGGQDTKTKQQELGADLELDVSYQWLRFFLEDDEELAKIAKDYGSGSGDFWSTHKVKERLIQVCQELVAEHQARRAKVTDADVLEWMRERSIV
ncbi:hypothetical protein MPSEU_000754300 [Mayamaea pseudoterrestris]|nr:hypothetical protein MPSEU_000754300 [Mayamaea pseudoterrestris]